MKKSSVKFSLIFFILLGLSITHDASAQLPFAASFDFAGEIKGIIQDIQAALKTVETNVVGRIKDSLGKLQAAYDKYSGQITKVIDKIPGTKDFKIGSALSNASHSGGSSYQNIDIYDPEAVKAAFTELFLTYPSDDKLTQMAYDRKSNQFYYDTLVEVKAAIIALEQQLDKLRAEVDDFSEQAMSGSGEGGGEASSGGESDGAASSEDDSGIIYNAYLSNRKFNDILKVTEEVVALQNQYFAAKLLRRPRQIEPAQPESETQNNSFLYFHQRFDNAQFLKAKVAVIDDKDDSLSEKTTSTSAKVADEESLKTQVTEKTSAEATLKSQPVASTKASAESTLKSQPTASVKTSAGTTLKSQPVTSAKVSTGTVLKSQPTASVNAQTTMSAKSQAATSAPAATTGAKTQGSSTSAPKATSLVTTTSSAKSAISDDDFFDVPKAPETSSPLKHSQAELDAINKISETQELVVKAEEVHNLLQQLPSYRDTFVQYGLIQQLHAVAQSAVLSADTCVLKYLRNYYNNPNKVWFGSDTCKVADCVNSFPKKPFEYDERKGLSGWAISAYQLANASSGNNIDINEMMNPIPGVEDDDPGLVEVDTEKMEAQSEGLVTPDIDTSEYSDSVRETDPEKLTEERDGENEDIEDNFTDSDKAKEFSNTSREVSLINWQVGKAAVQMLANDQFGCGEPEFGKPQKKYPLWNDQRSFYDQYISGKYNNMKAYLNQVNLSEATLSIVEILNNEIENAEERAANQAGIDQLYDAISNNVGNVDNLNNLWIAKNAMINGLKQQETQALSSMGNALDAINKNIDNWTQLITEKNKEINALSEEKSHNEGTMETSKFSMLNLEKRGGFFSSLFSQAKTALQSAAEKIKEGISKLGDLRSKVKQFENTRKQAKAQALVLKEAVETKKQEFQDNIQAVESQFDEQLDEMQNALPIPTLSDIYMAANISNTGSLSSLISKADALIATARQCGAILIDTHLASLQSLAQGDELYTKSLLSEHIQLINQLKGLSMSCLRDHIEDVVDDPSVASNIMSVLRNIFRHTIVDDICSEYSCDSPDIEYFVGLPAKKRDFTAPRPASFDVYPTVRDVFHFDTTDYKNMKVNPDDGRISKEALLTSGAALPKIWQLMLSDNAYVEKGIDLGKVLNKGGEGKAFMRGYMLPCKLDKYIIDINENNGKYAVIDVTQDNTSDNLYRYNNVLSECRDLEMKLHLLDAYTLRDTDVKDNISGKGFSEVEDPVSSELGMLLKFQNHRLYINDDAFEGFEKLIKKEKKAEKKGKYDLKAEENVYQRAMFTKNQIGDFLHFMDKEKAAREKLEQASADIADLRATLKETLSALGFALDDNVNLANDEDYNEVVQKLQASKNTIMGQIASKINTINHSNPDVDERYQKINNEYMALMQDNKVLVNITDNTEAGSSLAESIKSEQANKKVVEKSRQDGYKALQDEINNYEQPVCIPVGVILPSYMAE